MVLFKRIGIFLISLFVFCYLGYWLTFNCFIKIDSTLNLEGQTQQGSYFLGSLFGYNVFGKTEKQFIKKTKIFDISSESMNRPSLIVNKGNEYILCAAKKSLTLYSKDGQLLGQYNIEDIDSTILDYCISDIDNDGNDKVLLVLAKKGATFGKRIVFLSLEESAPQTNHKNSIKIQKVLDQDFEAINPWRIQTADVDGDGIKEISLGVYKTARLHPVLAKRPFVYNWDGSKLTPKWLGSRLSRPFDDYIFADIDNDRLDELVSIEHSKSSKKLIAAYKWKGFGFEKIAESTEYENLTEIRNEKPKGQPETGLILSLKGIKGESYWARFYYKDNAFLLKEKLGQMEANTYYR